jgi:hypothetical protein
VATGADTVEVVTGEGARTPPVRAGTITVPVVGLVPDAVNRMRVIARRQADGAVAETPELTLQTAPLPADLPVVTVTTDRGTTGGALLLGLADFPVEVGYALIIDRKGRVLWYRRSPPTQLGVDFERLPNGNLMLFQRDALAFEELGLDSRVLRTWTSPASGGADGHDFVALPGDRMILFGTDPYSLDTRPFFDGGVPDATVVGATLDEIDADGGQHFHWASRTAILPDEVIVDPAFDPSLFEVLHPNSLALTPDGHLLAGFRQTSSLMKIDRQTGAILWRLGGKKSDFTIVDDPLTGFSRQHDARFLPNGDLLLLDNGNDHVPPVTRAVQYRLDEQARTATMVWQYRHAPDIFSFATGSARRLAGGHTLVSYGIPGVATEVDESGAVQWEARTPVVIYRALPIPSVYP